MTFKYCYHIFHSLDLMIISHLQKSTMVFFQKRLRLRQFHSTFFFIYSCFFVPFHYSLRWISHFPLFNIFSFCWALLRPKTEVSQGHLPILIPVVKTGYCRAVLTMKEFMKGWQFILLWQWTRLKVFCFLTVHVCVNNVIYGYAYWWPEFSRSPWIHGDL